MVDLDKDILIALDNNIMLGTVGADMLSKAVIKQKHIEKILEQTGGINHDNFEDFFDELLRAYVSDSILGNLFTADELVMLAASERGFMASKLNLE